MKKICAALVLFACCCGALCAQSVGVGYTMYWSNTRYSIADFGWDTQASKDDSELNGGGGFLYFDGIFVEANVGITYGSYREFNSRVIYNSVGKYMDMTAMKLALYLKGPWNFYPPWIVYPMLGVDWSFPIGAKINGQAVNNAVWNNIVKSFDHLWIKAGIGLDIPLRKVSLRPQFLAGFRLNTDSEREIINSRAPGRPEYERITGYMFEGRIALGYKF